MKIFKIIQNKLALLGINPNGLDKFNWKITMGLISFGFSIFTNVVFIFTIENIILMDYVQFFCITSALVLMCFCTTNIVSQRINLFGVIKNLENITKKSNLTNNFYYL